MKQNLTYKILLGLASTVFCIGFLISIVGGYYECNYNHFIDIGRADLIARLGFLSWTTGFLYYPLVIIVNLLTSFILKRTNKNIVKKQWIYLLAPAFLIGLLFYTHSIDFIVMEDIRFWRMGLILIGTSVLTYLTLLKIEQRKSKKTEHNKT
jgi:hypothetical protein